MSKSATEIIHLKKIKKDGFVDESVFNAIVSYLSDNKSVIVPVDFIYGICMLDTKENYSRLLHLLESEKAMICRLVPNFKMLEDLVNIGKLEFDFLHRIWPGEMVVYLEERSGNMESLPLRMPKSKLCQEIIGAVEKSVLYAPLFKMGDQPMYQKNAITAHYGNLVDCIVVIDEFCKEHTLPTILDIRNGELKIINEGRISAEEIKSLYFLGKDDSAD